MVFRCQSNSLVIGTPPWWGVNSNEEIKHFKRDIKYNLTSRKSETLANKNMKNIFMWITIWETEFVFRGQRPLETMNTPVCPLQGRRAPGYSDTHRCVLRSLIVLRLLLPKDNRILWRLWLNAIDEWISLYFDYKLVNRRSICFSYERCCLIFTSGWA